MSGIIESSYLFRRNEEPIKWRKSLSGPMKLEWHKQIYISLAR